ncbi:MAG: aspartate dehydrogenase [Methanomicrobiales archaeon]|nr:aspartate dehydrogenase [Methanomicrobiales archaeon]
MLRIGLLGCGNVGHIIAQHRQGFEIVALFDKIPGRAQELVEISGGKVFSDFASFIQEDFDLVVEAASVNAVYRYGEDVLSHGKDLVVLSVGALADVEFRDRLIGAARAHKKKIRIPSGAILGLDNIKIGQISRIDRLSLVSTKNPGSLGVQAGEERRLIFKGKANDCIRQFPKNINVAIALGLAAGREADVEIWADPATDRNIHEIFVEGEFGDVYIRVRNVPSPDNPATSYMAALSILTLLRNLEEPLVVGT